MADELTPVLGLIKPTVGGDTDAWGEMINTNSDTIDAAMGAVESEIAATNNAVALKADKTYVDSQDAAQNVVISTKAPLDSPQLTGNPTAPNQDTMDKDTSIANTAFVWDLNGTAVQAFGNPRPLTADDMGKTLMFNAGTLTVPDETTPLKNGFRCDVVLWDATNGDLVITGAAGVNVVHKSGYSATLTSMYSAATLIKVIPNLWLLIGDLAPV